MKIRLEKSLSEDKEELNEVGVAKVQQSFREEMVITIFCIYISFNKCA